MMKMIAPDTIFLTIVAILVAAALVNRAIRYGRAEADRKRRLDDITGHGR